MDEPKTKKASFRTQHPYCTSGTKMPDHGMKPTEKAQDNLECNVKLKQQSET